MDEAVISLVVLIILTLLGIDDALLASMLLFIGLSLQHIAHQLRNKQ